eukprot:1004889_1
MTSNNNERGDRSGKKMQQLSHSGSILRSENLEEHGPTQSHKHSTGFRCEFCCEMFNLKRSLVQHVSSKHKFPFKTEEPTATQSTPNHSKSPSIYPKWAYVCSVCQKSFVQQYVLDNHLC